MPPDKKTPPIDPNMDLTDYVQELVRPSKVLLVEDDEMSTELFQRIASQYNCELIWAQDQKSAERLLRTTEFDLTFLDVRLVHGSGLGVFRMMRNENIDVPVCILTGHLTPAMLDEVRSIGIAAVVVKPDDYSKTNLNSLFRTFGIKRRRKHQVASPTLIPVAPESGTAPPIPPAVIPPMVVIPPVVIPPVAPAPTPDPDAPPAVVD